MSGFKALSELAKENYFLSIDIDKEVEELVYKKLSPISTLLFRLCFTTNMEVRCADDLIRLFQLRNKASGSTGTTSSSTSTTNDATTAATIPAEALGKLAWEKISGEVFDAGNYVQLCMLATEEEEAEGEEEVSEGDDNEEDDEDDTAASSSSDGESEEYITAPEAGPFPSSMLRLVAATDMQAFGTVFLIDPMW